MTLSLAEHVADERRLMHKRLAREGLGDITELEYAKYLRSVLWERIRDWVHVRDENRCRICLGYQVRSGGMTGLEVHHRSYTREVLEGFREDQLMCLCGRCHERIEKNADGTRRTSLLEKDQELGRLTALHERIRAEGLLVRVAHQNARIAFTYVGDKAFLEFYELSDLLFSWVHRTWFTNRALLRVPLPLSRDKLWNASGLKLIHIKSNKPWLTVRAGLREGSIAVAKSCTIEIEPTIEKAFGDDERLSCYWRRVS